MSIFDGRAREEHESYGIIGVANISTSGDNQLFCSPLTNNHSVKITVKHAVRDRELHRDWVFARGVVCEVEMSSAQYAQMISSPNIGEGTPCTLRYIPGEGGRIPDPPSEIPPQERFSKELKDRAALLSTTLAEMVVASHMVLQANSPSKEMRRNLKSKAEEAQREILSSLPFLIDSFQQEMDNLTMKARAEFEAMMVKTLTDRGLRALQEDQAQLTETLDATE